MATIPLASAEAGAERARLGMWLFLATEAMFFGPLFFGYVHSRLADSAAFASGSHHMHFWLGTINTAVLLTSSFTMAISVHGKERIRGTLGLTFVLGAAFLLIKGYEYGSEIPEVLAAKGAEQVFYLLYFAMTGLHAIHLLIGLGLVAWLFLSAHGRRAGTPVEIVGLYWHFVDAVWLFLYPMFYLLERYSA
ncbi:MAG: cytochrome c oxidase subunit 3 [Betaproteobacteria bacterium]|nr:cytochrome c oxidase subunit 3 [Betaproteobacteria bacterium]